MTDQTITYNEWDELKPEPLTQIDKITDLTQWPAGAKDDGRLYRIGWTRNMRALMQNGDKHPDNPELDADGAIQWVPVDPRFEEPNQAVVDAIGGKSGSYIEMSKMANTLNARQDKNFGARSFTFYPTPADLAGAR